MPLLQAQEMTYTQVQQLPKDRSIAFLSASALEVHGPHLPLGMDMFAARWMAEETARRFAEAHPGWTVVLYPHIPLGTDELPLPGSVDGTQPLWRPPAASPAAGTASRYSHRPSLCYTASSPAVDTSRSSRTSAAP